MTAPRSTHMADWLPAARAIEPSVRAQLLAVPVSEPSSTVDPELAEALETLAVLVRRNGNCRRARAHTMRRILWPRDDSVAARAKTLDAHLRLTRVERHVQARLESALERVESLIAGGRK